MRAYRVRQWTAAWKRFERWERLSGHVDSIAYEVVARSFPAQQSDLFPGTRIWEIQLADAETDAFVPHLCVTLTTYPVAVRIARHDRPRHALLDAIAESKLADLVIHHRDMLAGGWTHQGGGAYVLPAASSRDRTFGRAHPS
ncbi:MAG: hypothetical protein WCO25_03995 [Candidatus Uhrbacteria bacterium]